jgi:hypothetical protein
MPETAIINPMQQFDTATHLSCFHLHTKCGIMQDGIRNKYKESGTEKED